MTPEVVKYQTGLLMAKRGMRTFDDLAARLGISKQHLSNILACRQRPARLQLRIARLLGTTPLALFGRYCHRDLVDLRNARAARHANPEKEIA